MDVRTVIEAVLRGRDEPSPWTATNDILAALKEAGMVIVPEFDLDLLDKALHEIEPRRRTQREPNQTFREFWCAALLIARVERHLAIAQEHDAE